MPKHVLHVDLQHLLSSRTGAIGATSVALQRPLLVIDRHRSMLGLSMQICLAAEVLDAEVPLAILLQLRSLPAVRSGSARLYCAIGCWLHPAVACLDHGEDKSEIILPEDGWQCNQ